MLCEELWPNLLLGGKAVASLHLDPPWIFGYSKAALFCCEIVTGHFFAGSVSLVIKET
jgi:hypothetical protein